MANSIPDDAELRFIETIATGTVHIAIRYSLHHLGRQPEIEAPVQGGAAFVAMAHAPTITRCGRRVFPQFEDRHLGTDRFRDDQLCAACHRTLTPADQQRAFEHAEPGDEDDEEAAA